MRRVTAPIAILVFLLGIIAALASPSPGLGQASGFAGCSLLPTSVAMLTGTPTAALLTPPIVAAPDMQADVPAGGSFGPPTVRLWLQRFTLPSGGSITGCFRGYTLVWVESGSVNVAVRDGCVETTPPFDTNFLPGTPSPNRASCATDGTPTTNLTLAADGQALLVDARVTISSRGSSNGATVIMSAMDPAPPGSCGGRPC